MYPIKILGNNYKNAQIIQGKNGWTQWKFEKKNYKINKWNQSEEYNNWNKNISKIINS